jgi:LAS superfamily LD-carboxypeptidase LdcB
MVTESLFLVNGQGIVHGPSLCNNKSMDKLKPKQQLIGTLPAIALFISIGALYGQYQIHKLSSNVNILSTKVNSLEIKLASTTAELNANIAQTHNSLSDALKQNSATIEQQLGNYQQQVSTVSNTVGTLQKLSKTDPQLLQKYSKVFFLNEYYAPAKLIEVPSDYAYSNTKQLKFQVSAWQHLRQMLDDAKASGVDIYIFSAYRSFNEQSALKSEYKVVYGEGTANSFSADQGYSEHQLGTAVDLITTGLGGVLDGFDNTKAYAWLLANAYRYGFIISYPKNNSFYVFEPWHWRFVGVLLATDLHNQNQNFYDLDQRKIDEYLVNFFD